jgi:ribosomal protein L16/L10AE
MLTLSMQMRMGKGKGSFDYWATRMAVNQIAFELRGSVHEQVVRDAFRLAGGKLPGGLSPGLRRAASSDDTNILLP